MQGIARPHRDRCASWACKLCASNLGRRLEEKLGRVIERAELEGLAAILISVTIDRKPWIAREQGPLEVWNDVRLQHRVSRAVGAFCRHYKVPSEARFMTKLELQRAGWPHWHVLLLVPKELVDKLPRPDTSGTGGAFDAFWKLGFSNVRFEGAARYLCKYACKEAGSDADDALRDSGLPAKNVHWIMPSRNFWRKWGESSWSDADECSCFKDEVCSGQLEANHELHADRVNRCRTCSVLDFQIGSRTVRVGVPVSRRVLANHLEFVACEGIELDPDDRPGSYFESGVLEWVPLDDAEVYDLLHDMGQFDAAEEFWRELHTPADEQHTHPLRALFNRDSSWSTVGSCGRWRGHTLFAGVPSLAASDG